MAITSTSASVIENSTKEVGNGLSKERISYTNVIPRQMDFPQRSSDEKCSAMPLLLLGLENSQRLVPVLLAQVLLLA